MIEISTFIVIGLGLKKFRIEMIRRRATNNIRSGFRTGRINTLAIARTI